MYKENNSIIGKMMILEGLVLIVPLLVLPFYINECKYIYQFVYPAIISILMGLIVCYISSKYHENTKQKKLNSSKIVVFSWLYGFLLAAIPFYLHGNLSFVQSLFESVSGFTTTGLSVLDVSKLPKIFLFYRGFLQYVGGLGFVLMMIVFVQGKESVDLYQAEGHPDRLMPNIGKTAKVIFFMYSFFLVIGVILYAIFGMPIFDGIVHTMCALSTGGFSNKLDSIAYYNSLPIEIVTIILMLIGTTNFSLLLLLFKRKFRAFTQSSEMRFLTGLVLISVVFMTVFLTQSNISTSQSIRLSFFNAFSAISTTGYATCSYQDWPQTAIALMIILMIVGGGIGSTAGGVKLGRVCILCKNLWKNIKKKMLPERSVIISYYYKGNEEEVLSEDYVEEANTYAQVYILIFIIGTIAITYFSQCSLLEAAFEFASSLGTVGLSIGLTSMNTAPICLIIEIIGMILGRLEIFVIFKSLYRE